MDPYTDAAATAKFGLTHPKSLHNSRQIIAEGYPGNRPVMT